MNKGALQLYKKIEKRKIPIHQVCEVGVYLPEESNVLPFIEHSCQAILIEADPEYAENARRAFNGKDVKIIEGAAYDYEGTIQLSKRKSSTFITELTASPAIINDGYSAKENDGFSTRCFPFSSIDPGTIDLLSVDIEGAEWFVIKHLTSRPAVISLETHGKYYTNPYIKEILAWMESNSYDIWYKTKSDTVFVKQGLIHLSFLDKIKIGLFECRQFLIQVKGLVKGKKM